MVVRLPGLTLTDQLAVRLETGSEVRLSPKDAFSLAEGLLRGGARKAVVDAARQHRAKPHTQAPKAK